MVLTVFARMDFCGRRTVTPLAVTSSSPVRLTFPHRKDSGETAKNSLRHSKEKGETRVTRSTKLVAGLVLGGILALPWLALNISASVPLGLYRKTAVPQPLARGDLVILSVPSSVRAWQRIPLLKPVAAVAGDTVCNVEETLWIGTQSYGRVWQKAHGRPLPHVEGCLTIPDGEVFVASTVPYSLDSRYAGAIPIRALTAGAVPLFTWR